MTDGRLWLKMSFAASGENYLFMTARWSCA